MKNLKKIILIILLLVLLIYVCYITCLPSSYIILQGETLNLPTMAGISVKQTKKSMQTASNIGTPIEKTGKIDFSVNLFDFFTLKKFQVNVLPKTTVIPIGKAIRNEVIYRWCVSSRNV